MEMLGTGAFSSCYAARDKSGGTLMAVKQVMLKSLVYKHYWLTLAINRSIWCWWGGRRVP